MHTQDVLEHGASRRSKFAIEYVGQTIAGCEFSRPDEASPNYKITNYIELLLTTQPLSPTLYYTYGIHK